MASLCYPVTQTVSKLQVEAHDAVEDIKQDHVTVSETISAIFCEVAFN